MPPRTAIRPPFLLCAAATDIAPATASGPAGFAIPVIVSRPPVISVAAALAAICLPGARPFFSNSAPAPSRPGPWNFPSSFCEAWISMYPPSSSLAPSSAASRMMSSVSMAT